MLHVVTKIEDPVRVVEYGVKAELDKAVSLELSETFPKDVYTPCTYQKISRQKPKENQPNTVNQTALKPKSTATLDFPTVLVLDEHQLTQHQTKKHSSIPACKKALEISKLLSSLCYSN